MHLITLRMSRNGIFNEAHGTSPCLSQEKIKQLGKSITVPHSDPPGCTLVKTFFSFPNFCFLQNRNSPVEIRWMVPWCSQWLVIPLEPYLLLESNLDLAGNEASLFFSLLKFMWCAFSLKANSLKRWAEMHSSLLQFDSLASIHFCPLLIGCVCWEAFVKIEDAVDGWNFLLLLLYWGYTMIIQCLGIDPKSRRAGF